MTLAAIILLAFAMSTDAFAAAIGKGAGMDKPRLSQALRIGLLFGVIEGLTPLIGWAIGSVASQWAAAWDHWIAFFLLVGLGAHMAWAGLGEAEEEPVEEESAVKSGAAAGASLKALLALALTAFATSIDALAVGVSLAFVDVNIWIAALAIGMATTLMVTIGVMVGRALGSVFGQRAEIIGGVVLMGVGAVILYEGLHA